MTIRPPLPKPTAASLRGAPIAALALALVSGCADRPTLRDFGAAREQLRAELAAKAAAAPAPAEPASAPEPARKEVPPEPRFDLVVNGANARDVFLSIVADTRYSLLMHPQVGGVLSATLRGVTVREALESIRDVYGYDFRIDGRRITVFPPTLQMRIFSVNYLMSRRQGSSEVRVSSSAAPNTSTSSSGGTTTKSAPDSSQITTTMVSDYWQETADALRAMVGKGEGRQVIVSPQAGTIAVRALPDELREVEKFLQASKLAVERQVMLEAKIVSVELNDGFQSGIDWTILGTKPGALAGQTSGFAGNRLLGNTAGLPTLGAAVGNAVDGVGLPAGGGGAFGIALRSVSRGFEGVLGFLETQGDLQVLSSPRVATLNNQKAVLKVGVDEYFLTNISGGNSGTGTGTTTTSASSTTLPTLTLTPFFSGIALDVTPQIDETGMITLHMRPSVTSVSEKTKVINLGSQFGSLQLPLAASTVNETDTVVRVADGNIVAIGGLMQVESSRNSAGLPGRGDTALGRTLLGNNKDSSRKKELVVLIRPTIIRSAEDWQRSAEQAQSALADRSDEPRRVITLNGSPKP